MAREFVGKVELRNTYRVYSENGGYLVSGQNRRGQSFETEISPEAVSFLRERLAGKRVNAEDAGRTLAPKAERFKLPYTYGDKLRYSGQHVLTVLVALDQATVEKDGRSYMYRIATNGRH